MHSAEGLVTKIPLIVERHPIDYNGYPFITLIEYNKTAYLTIVDNCTDSTITCYVLDKCNAEGIDELQLVQAALQWFGGNKEIPLSIALSREGMSHTFRNVISSFCTEFVTRVIGPLPRYNFTRVKKVRRRRKRSISSTIAIVDRTRNQHPGPSGPSP